MHWEARQRGLKKARSSAVLAMARAVARCFQGLLVQERVHPLLEEQT